MTEYEIWVEGICAAEHAIAKKHMAAGKNPTQVLDTMSKNIIKKLLHPIFTDLRNTKTPYDSEKSKQEYKEMYLDHVKKAPDHIEN